MVRLIGEHLPLLKGVDRAIIHHGMRVTRRDTWIRQRWGPWLEATLAQQRIALRALSKVLAAETDGDHRGTLRNYCRQQSTVSADKAFAIGEAIASLSPGSWINGPYAVAIAGYYEELLAFIESLHSFDKDELMDAPELAAIHLPFVAEFELAKLSCSLGPFVNAACKMTDSDKVPRDVSRLVRAIRNGKNLLLRFSVLRHAYRRAGIDPEDVFCLKAAWDNRHKKRIQNRADEFAVDRDVIVTISMEAAQHNLEPHRQASTILSLVWQWVTLVPFEIEPRHEFIMNALRRYSILTAERRHYDQNEDSYVKEEAIPGIVLDIPVDSRIREVPLEKRIDDLKQFADAERRFRLESIRIAHLLCRLEEFRDLTHRQEERFMSGVQSRTPVSA